MSHSVCLQLLWRDDLLLAELSWLRRNFKLWRWRLDFNIYHHQWKQSECCCSPCVTMDGWIGGLLSEALLHRHCRDRLCCSVSTISWLTEQPTGAQQLQPSPAASWFHLQNDVAAVRQDVRHRHVPTLQHVSTLSWLISFILNNVFKAELYGTTCVS